MSKSGLIMKVQRWNKSMKRIENLMWKKSIGWIESMNWNQSL